MSPTRLLFCLLVLSCGSEEGEAIASSRGGAAFPAVLEAVIASPGKAQDLCAELESPSLRGECLAAAAEALAQDQPELAETFCSSIETDLEGDECFFQLSERTANRELCTRSGRFEEDCQMHAWTRALTQALDKSTRPGEVEAEVSALAEVHGFSSEDPRPWVALYRRLLGQMSPMDRESCTAVGPLQRQEICTSTGLALFHDRLNYLRDRKLFPCNGGELPSELNTRLDPELEQAMNTRIEEDLCP